VSLTLLLFVGFVAVLLAVLVWAVRAPRGQRRLASDPRAFEEVGQRHVSYLVQIRQAMAPADYEFLSKRASRGMQQRISRERRKVVRAYLEALREDFQSLLRMAKVIAVLAPEVVAVQEFDRLRLAVSFAWRYQLIRWRLWTGWAPRQQLDALGELVSGLSARMDAALKELGERAAHAAELASAIDRRGLDAG
jgi:hypothetical protein